jgi:cell division protein FtsQ
MAGGSRRAKARAAVLPFPYAPSLPRLRPGDLLPSRRALLIGFGIFAATALAYLVARQTSMFALRTVEIEGAPPRVAAHVRTALRPLVGESLLAVHARDVTQRLERLPELASVTYDRDFPHTLRLRVTPAHTIAVVRSGRWAWLVSSDGRVIRAVERAAAPLLPRVWLPRGSDVVPGRTLSQPEARQAVGAIAEARRSGFGERIRAVRSSDSELTFVLENDLELRFGDVADLEAKLAVTRSILPLTAGFGYVDVSVPERPVAGGSLNSEVEG